MRTRLLEAVLVVLVILALVFLLGHQRAAAPALEAPHEAAATTTAPLLAAAAYPLYDGVSWAPPEAFTFSFMGSTTPGVSVDSVPVMDTMDPASVFSPFEKYYADKLAADGWTVDNALAAGGHTGGQTAYRKGTALILTNFHITYHTVPADAPSECPCDVTVSLFSSAP